MRHEGEVAVVTGGARRLGRHLALALARRGFAVAIHYHGSRDAAEETAAEIRHLGARSVAVGADLGDPAAPEGLIAAAGTALGPLTCLVNNASLFEHDGALELEDAAFDRHQAVNLRAPLLLARDFARQLPPAAEGLIVNLLDQRIAAPPAGWLSYTLSKIGLAAATGMLALELAPRIRVNGIAPGLTLPSGAQSQADFERELTRTPLGRGSSPEAVIRALEYLLDAEAVTGQILYVDGGRRLWGGVPDDPGMRGEPPS
jgi:NAD(P)-dependent dehydrogenase (short-subunit alcohol dehydrogenase family)